MIRFFGASLPNGLSAKINKGPGRKPAIVYHQKAVFWYLASTRCIGKPQKSTKARATIDEATPAALAKNKVKSPPSVKNQKNAIESSDIDKIVRTEPTVILFISSFITAYLKVVDLLIIIIG